eukprot:1625753-Pyramimonas_sp.AAC.1
MPVHAAASRALPSAEGGTRASHKRGRSTPRAICRAPELHGGREASARRHVTGPRVSAGGAHSTGRAPRRREPLL